MNYYNDIDPYACQWLRNLIEAGELPNGIVDDRSIREVDPIELEGFDQCHFFAGIGGWPLALAIAGWPSHQPVWTGSCPCQPFSVAGRRKGIEDERHLWPEFQRLISQCQPPVVFGEQVASKDGRIWLSGVRTDLEALGYAVGASDMCAAGVGAPHIRQRLWWVADRLVAYCRGVGRKRREGSEERGQHDREDARWQQGDDGPVGIHETGGGGMGYYYSGLEGATRKELQGGLDGSACSSQNGGMDHPTDARRTRKGVRRQDSTSRDKTRMQEPAGRMPSGWVANNNNTGLEGRGEAKCASQDPAGPRSMAFWENHELIPCSDGRWRRVEPGTFPLAHGVPARVGKLRAYGNAIVPWVAAEFVQAYQEAIADMERIQGLNL